jgi:glycosyltransferase involved in cell wall biosynthesis
MNSIISVVLPCRNEKETVGRCIREIKKVAGENSLSIEIIVSDSSNDGTEKIAETEGVRVIKHDTEGYGFAVKEGIKNASGEIIIYADADNTYQFTDIPKFLKELEKSDIVLGSRFRGTIETGAMPLLHRFLGTPLFNLLLFVLLGIKTSDSQSGYRALRKKTFLELDQKTNGMEFATEMMIKAKRKNLVIKEIATDYSRRGGTSKLRRYRDGFAHLKYILIQTPIVFYLVTGSMLFITGMIGLLWGNHITPFLASATVKIFFPILGIQILFLGLFAKTYLTTRLGETDEFIKNFYEKFKFSFALILGFLFIGGALVMKITGTSEVDFDKTLVSILIGLQVIFNSTILSTLSIK